MIQFATCERHRALEFLRVAYPKSVLEDSGATAALLDCVQRDELRVTDPDYHTPSVVAGTHYDAAKAFDYSHLAQSFHREAMANAKERQ